MNPESRAALAVIRMRLTDQRALTALTALDSLGADELLLITSNELCDPITVWQVATTTEDEVISGYWTLTAIAARGDASPSVAG